MPVAITTTNAPVQKSTPIKVSKTMPAAAIVTEILVRTYPMIETMAR
jgi:hypothetical protein